MRYKDQSLLLAAFVEFLILLSTTCETDFNQYNDFLTEATVMKRFVIVIMKGSVPSVSHEVIKMTFIWPIMGFERNRVLFKQGLWFPEELHITCGFS